MMLIYCPEESPRVAWTLELVFRQWLGIDYRLTTFREELEHAEGPKLNYSFAALPGIPFIEASGLLFEQGVRDQSARLIPGGPWAGQPTIFNSQAPEAGIPFDLLSAVFYFVTRYEEYLPFEPDEHHRFRSTESLSFHLGLLETPVVNWWILEFARTLESWYHGAVRPVLPEYRFMPTIDIDNAWAYANKGLRRTIGGLWKDRRDMEATNFRFQVLRHNQADPFQTYELIHRFHEESAVQATWFFLVASYGKYDKNTYAGNHHFRELIRNIAARNPVGIHPSYASDSEPELLGREIERLSNIIGKHVTCSRQHYLRIRMPDTYRTLANLGIREDFSMGFADSTGFRAGTAWPFLFFDLEENKSSSLLIRPFCLMDTGLHRYMNLKPAQAIEKITILSQEVRNARGTFISLWHNESLSEWKDWEGWSEVYRQMLMIAKLH